MKEKPILFSAPMVLAILDDKKTQTRRIVKPQPDADGKDFFLWRKSFIKRDDILTYAPYKIDTVLWVRETFIDESDYPCSDYNEDPENNSRYTYRADVPEEHWKELIWKPSIYMPKNASRIKLLVKDVRAERVQDITEADAIAEGILMDEHHFFYDKKKTNVFNTAVGAYNCLWNKINGAENFEKVNPFVWVITFERIL